MKVENPPEHEEPSYRAFAQMVAHDLAAPLNQIALYADLVERNADALDEKTGRYVRRMKDAAQRAAALLESLHRVAKSGWDDEQAASVSLATVVAEVLADTDGRLQRAGAKVRVGELPTVMGRARQLYQLFSNLVDNAVKYSGGRPPDVAISAARRGTDWVVTVRDQGVGIPDGHRESVFEPFKRLDPTRKDGFGIGLTTCRRIVEAHGGRIWVEPVDGTGAAISFSLPA